MSSPISPFSSLGLHPTLLEAVLALGYEVPTPVQVAAIPPLVAGKDVLGLAATGTGKTAAFALPMLHRFANEAGTRAVTGLVIVPTRELAGQVARAVLSYGKQLGVRVLPVYGGAPMGPQLRALSRGVDVVVATPGRALDHLNRGTLRLDSVRSVVLDEADEMLDMGFQEDIEQLLAACPVGCQKALFSATLPSRLRRIADSVLEDPVRVELRPKKSEAGARPDVVQIAHVLRNSDKNAALARILDLEEPDAMLVFCRTRIAVDELVESLVARGLRAEPLHGGMSQGQRERVMARLRSRRADLLVCTDVAARGIDIPHLSHVVNYELPNSPEAYTHRIGRTGRAGRKGRAISFISRRERRTLVRVERAMGVQIPIVPLPTLEELRDAHLRRLKVRVSEVVEGGDLGLFRRVVAELAEESELDPIDVAAAALRALHDEVAPDESDLEVGTPIANGPRKRDQRRDMGHPEGIPWAQIQFDIGRRDQLRPGDLVGAITNEAGLSSRDIGSIDIVERCSFVEIRADAVGHVLDVLHGVTIRGRSVRGRPARPKPNYY
jgi:ATP-dependent RNA helicase DeaD